MRLLVTGATGFVGRALCRRLQHDGITFIAAVRYAHMDISTRTELATIGEIDGNTDWTTSLKRIDIVVHLAGRAHVIKERVNDPLSEFRKINVEGTLNLARQAAHAGVKRFVFISSIKVNGESTTLHRPFHPADMPLPEDPYGTSKMEAEQGLATLGKETGMEIVIVRPPLVYGPGVKGNFQNMMAWIGKGIPLPLGAIYNRRSLVALDNLIDFIVACISHPAAANQTFLVSDDEDISTTELLRKLGAAMGKPIILMPVPTILLKIGASLIDSKSIANRLCGNLQVDVSQTRKLLGWTPPISLDEGLRKAVGKM